MYLYPPLSFQVGLPAGLVIGRCKEHISMKRSVRLQSRNILLELLIAAGTGCGEHLGCHEVRFDALDIATAARTKRQTESLRLRVHFNELFDCPL